MTQPVSPIDAVVQSAAFGEVVLTPDAADTCAKACDVYIAGLEDIRDSVARMNKLQGFGTLPSGVALGEKFGALSAETLPQVLAGHIEVAMRLKSVFEEAGRRYDETESHTTSSILASGD